MPNGENMGACAPLSAFPWGVLRRQDPVHDVHRNAVNKSKSDDSMELAGDEGRRNAGDVEGFLESVADNVDEFLGDFLVLAGPSGRSGTVEDFLTFVGARRGSGGGSGGGSGSVEAADVVVDGGDNGDSDVEGAEAVVDGGDFGNIAEEDLMAAFLPPASAASVASAVTGAAAGAVPSPANEIESTAATMVGGSGAAASAASLAAWPTTSPADSVATAASEASRTGGAGVGYSPLACLERAPSAAAVDRTPAVGVAPAVLFVRAAGAATAGGVVGRGEGRSGCCCDGTIASGGGDAGGAAARRVSPKEQLRKLKVARYLDKKTRRRWSKGASYQSRQRVANSRPRHKGRFLPLESDFLPIAEMQRRQRDLVKQMQEEVAAAAATVRAATAGA